ncbi:MAG: carbohydrate ABC transporter permease [Anaerolineae bacterium]|nr:carbohydrate ABC transporter permease [Anaerolineae bacterium]MDW8069993.1 carbohydrate ABC transporter permease [Anaerolineae bacterium]
MRRMSPLQKLVSAVILVIALILFLFPVVWMFLTSFKTEAEYFSYPPVFIPRDFSPRNYLNAMMLPPDGRGGLQGLRDSLIVALSTTIVSMLIGSLAAYSLSRFKTGGENLSFWILSTRMFPPVAAALPLFLIFKELRLLDTHWALIIANTVFNLPFVIWMLKGFFDDLSPEMEEAALIDGCTHWDAFIRVALPLITPGLVATALFSFIFAWNEFMFALLLTRRSVRTLTVIVPSLVGGHEILWGEIAAIGTIAIIPGIVLSVLFQRFLVRGLTMGAVKG